MTAVSPYRSLLCANPWTYAFMHVHLKKQTQFVLLTVPLATHMAQVLWNDTWQTPLQHGSSGFHLTKQFGDMRSHVTFPATVYPPFSIPFTFNCYHISLHVYATLPNWEHEASTSAPTSFQSPSWSDVCHVLVFVVQVKVCMFFFFFAVLFPCARLT